MKYMNYKTINKLFVFLAIIVILFNVTTATMFGAVSNLELGCDTTSKNITRNTEVENAIKTFYQNEGFTVKTGDFKCYIGSLSTSDQEQYTEVMATYRDHNNKIRHSSVFTKLKFGMDDLHLDIDGGRLVVSGLMVSDVDAWNRIYDGISGIITGLSGVGILCCLLAFTMNILKLGAAASNPAEREKALKGILWTGVATAGCGAAALIFGVAYNLL